VVQMHMSQQPRDVTLTVKLIKPSVATKT